jgi:activator of Hsp90 ATPase-like protein
VFTWGGLQGLAPGASTVEFHVEPHGAGTLLRLRHHGLPKSRIETHRYGWADFGLPKLKDAAEGHLPATRCVSDIVQMRLRNDPRIAKPAGNSQR